MSDNYTQDFIDEVKGALNSGSSGGGTIDQTARDDISNHVANSGVHVTVNDKTSWNNKAELSDIPTTLPASGGNADTVDGLHASDIQIDAVSDTAELVTLDNLQGGVPFSDITVSGKNLITEVLSAALGGNSTDGFRITDNPYCRSFVQKLLPNTTYTVKRYDSGNRFRIILFNEYPTITADTTANQILNATTTPSEFTFTTGSDHLWFALTTHNGTADNTVVEPIVQLEYGDTTTEYEPPIVGQEITLTTCGKNLIPYPYNRSNGIYNGITIDISDDGKFSVSGVATAGFALITFANQDKPIKLVAGRVYTISCSEPYDINNFNLFFKIYHTDGTYSGVTSYPTTFIAKDGDYITGSLWVDEGTSFNVSNVSIQIELGDTATEYEPYSGTTTRITPDINPYTVPNSIRQQDGTNNVSISAGEVSVTGVKKNAAIKKIWDNKADLSDIQIDSVSDTAELVTLDGLQGGVPFSSITVSSKNHINLTDYTAFPNMIASTAVGGSDSLTVSYSDSIARTWTYIAYSVAVKPNTVYHIKCTAETANGFAGLSVLQSDLSSFSPSVYKWGGNEFSLSFDSGNNDRVFVRFYTNASHTTMTEASVTYHNIMLSEYKNAEYIPEIIGQDITLSACGKNLIPYPYARTTETVKGVTFTDNGDGTITVNGTATESMWYSFTPKFKLHKNCRYTFSCGVPVTGGPSIEVGDGIAVYLSIFKNTNDTSVSQYVYPPKNNDNVSFTAEYEYVYVTIRISRNSVIDNVVVKPQLEFGEFATEYEPYNGSVTTITPDSNPYTVPNDIRQQDGINNVSVSTGEVSVTGVKKSPVINRAWEELDSHTNNTTVHATAEEKAAWNGKFDYIGVVHDLFAVNKTCVCAYDMNTLNTPFSSGLTLSGAGLCFVNYVAGAEYATYLVISSGDTNHYAATSNNGSEHVKWHKISDGGNADTLDNLHSSSFMQWIGEQNDTTIIGDANYKNNYLCNVETGKSLLGLPTEGWYHIEYHQHINDNGYGMQIAYPLNFTGSIMVRYAVGTTWGKWSNIADGGNADTLDGLHASDIQIDSISDTAELVTLDNLQGGVLFSDITVSGKNLIPYPYENNVTRGGITYVLNDDGTISMSGTATEVSSFNLAVFMDILLKKGITYTLSTGIIEGSAEQYDVVLVTKSGMSVNSYVEVNIESNKKTFTPENDIECRMLLRVLTGNTVNCTITAMLELGDNSTEYECPIVGKEITLTVNDTEYTVTPNSNPYTIQGIRQQEGINNVSVSAGEITVSGVRKSPIINRLWGEIENKISLSDIPDSLPANGGNADTINGKRINCNIYTHPVQFGITEADTADDIWKALPDSSIFMAGQSLFTDTSWSFPSGTATFTLVMIKLTAQRTGGIYLYPKNTTGNIYHAVLDNDGNFKAVWYKINDGGDAATLGSHPASDFVLKSDYDALAARVAALEARTTE